MKANLLKILFYVSIFILCAQSSFAELPIALRVYTSHGEINTIYEAFLKLSLIASDARYIGLCFVLLIVSFFVTAYQVFGGKGMIGQMGVSDVLSLVFTFLVACVLLRAFIIPRTDVTIDDVTMGQTMTVPDVPDGIVLLVNGMNVVENAIIEIINTSGTPDGFINNPGGTGFNIINKMFDKQIDLAGTPGGTDISINIQNYIADCVSLALKNNTNGLNIDEFMQTTNYLPALAKAANPALFTTLANGASVTCSASYTNIATYFGGLNTASPAVTKWSTRFCSEAGWFDYIWVFAGLPKLTTCWNNATNFIGSNIVAAPVTLPQIFQQILITQELYKFTTSGNTNAGVLSTGNYSQGNAMVSAGLLSAEWMPQIKAMILAAFLGMSPILLAFLASTMWKKILMFMIGCLTFFTVWGVCDAVMHDFAMAKALEVMRGVAQGQLGLKSVLMFSEESMKAYAVFGQYKVWSMGLAVFFAGAFVKGGNELGRIAAGRASDMKSTADSAGADMTDPVRNASKRESLAAAVPTQGIYNSGAYGAMADVAEYTKKSGVYASQGIMNEMGGSDKSPDAAALATVPGRIFALESANADAKGLSAVSNATNLPGQTILDHIAAIKHSKNTGEWQALKDEAGNIAGVVKLTKDLSSYGVGQKLAELGSLKKGAAQTGKSVRNLQNEIADVAAAKAIEDAASFKRSAAKHYGPGDKGMYAMAKDFAEINNLTGVGRNQALRAVAKKHYGGEGNIAEAEKDLQTFNRLKNVADKNAHDAIAQKHFGGDPDKMYAAMAMASVAKASGDAVAQKEVAQRYFGGDQHDMNKAASLYDNTVKASKLTSFGSGLKSTADKVGAGEGAEARAKADLVSKINPEGIQETSVASEVGKRSQAVWSSLMDNMANGTQMSDKMRQTLANLISNPNDRAQLNANGRGLYLHMPDDQGKAIALGKKLGMSEADSASLAGSGITLNGGVDEKGRLSFTNVDSKSGTAIEKGDKRSSNYTGVLANMISGSSDQNMKYARQLMRAKNNNQDRGLSGEGGSAIEREVESMTGQLVTEMGNLMGYSQDGSTNGTSTFTGDITGKYSTPPKGLSGSASGSWRGSHTNTESEKTNLLTSNIRRQLSQAVRDSGSSEALLAQKLTEVGRNLKKIASENIDKDEWDFGVTGHGGSLIRNLKKLVD